MEIVKLKTSQLVHNEGQVEGLPRNPRQWTREDVERIAASLKETPELFEMRPCIVYPHEGKYIILGGNLRLAGSIENKAKTVPCIILPAETSVEKMKEIVIKDNGSFGSFDYDELANEWDDLPLADWGVPVWKTDKVSPDDFGEGFDLDNNKSPFQQVAFNLSDEQAAIVKQALEEAKGLEEYKYVETFGNSNTNGNALYLIIQQWAEQRK